MRTLLGSALLCENKVTTGATVAGTVINVTDACMVISGTATSIDIDFECSIDGENWVLIEGWDIKDSSVSATNTTTINNGFTFDVDLIRYIRCNINTLSGGYVTIKIDYYVISN